MSFTRPDALWLFLLLPVFVAVGWPRLAYRRLRDTLGLAVRLVIVALLVLALAGLQMQRTANRLAVVFLIDVSDSVTPDLQTQALDYVRSASEAMGRNDEAAVIVFGANALVEIPITQQLELAQMGSDPIRLNTDLAEAMRLGLALFPADTAKRMVVLSDGRETVGDSTEVARLAAATNVQIDYVFLAPDSVGQQVGPEVLITDVRLPASVNAGEAFDLAVTIASSQPGSMAEIRVLSSGAIIYREAVELRQGTNSYVLSNLAVPAPGFADFRVVVEPLGADNFYQNNQLSAFTEVTGPPRVLLVATEDEEVASLRAALEEAGLVVEQQGPHDLPLGLAPLSSYDSVILANVSGADLTVDRMRYLQAYVRDLGGGLVVIGGPSSFGVGGYYDTPLEETLPVEMQLRDKKRIPQLTMLFVIDRSGSMEIAAPSGVSNLELAKEAVIRSFDLLQDTDRTGVLSFDVSAYYVLDLQEVGNAAKRAELRARVGALRPGGGTSIRQGLLSADRVLRDDPSHLKHIILLTDGGSDPEGIVPAVDQMYQDYGVTTSVIAIGRDFAPWLQDVAIAGRGKFHLAYDVSTIPAIFTAETLLATRAYIVEETFHPAISAQHPIIAGIDSAPELLGYIATTPKQTATVILRGPQDDPILAAWQYGLGRAVAFTSDASARWAAEWIDWPGYADFWTQAVQWSIIEGSTSNIEAHVVERGEEAVLTVDARTGRGDFLNGLALEASVTNAQLDSVTVPLRQTAPGHYEAVFTPEQEGSYFITVAGSAGSDGSALTPQQVRQTAGWVLSYSSEYRVDTTGSAPAEPLALLDSIARLTGGRSLGGAPASAFAHNLDQQRAAKPLWPSLLLAATLLLPLDVAVRRLVLTRRDLAAARSRIFGAREALEPTESARMGRLMDAKGRARAPVIPDGPARPPSAGEPDPARRRPLRPRATHPLAPPKVRPPEKPGPAEGTLASRLLERRRDSDARENDEG
ncbi:MAG: VWA domain-containing protein [Anaerolineae bacterium]|nr:VWA domain-containing protein [Anaerolineae bacterium]